MPNETFLCGVVKIHRKCGGIVRFVEDLEQSGIEFSGECLHCETTKIPEENCIYLYEEDLPDELSKKDLVETAASTLRELNWSETWRSYEVL